MRPLTKSEEGSASYLEELQCGSQVSRLELRGECPGASLRSTAAVLSQRPRVSVAQLRVLRAFVVRKTVIFEVTVNNFGCK